LLVLIIISLIIALPVKDAESDVASELRNIFDSLGMSASSSNAGAYYSQSRGYLVGGSLTARAPTKYASPLTIQLPDMKAGCGGIDMFFGGFQFINAEEFKRFLQAAGTAAIGYAFHMALQAVCPTCDETLKALRKFANEVNQFGLDSCTAGRMIANLGQPLYGALNQAQASLGQLSGSDGTSEGLWSPVKGWLETATKSIEELHQDMYNAARDPKAPMRAGISVPDNLRMSTLDETQMEIAVSILGTKAPVRGSDEGGTEITTAECVDFMPLITVSDILEGSQPDNPIKVWRCASGSFVDGTCDYIVKAEVPNFEGYRKFAQDMLFSIRDKLIDNNSLSENERKFINSIPGVPIKSALSAAIAASPTMVDAVIANISDLAAVSYAMYVINSYYGIYRQNSTKYVCGDDPRKRYIDLTHMLANEFGKYMSGIEMTTKLIAFVNSLERSSTTYASQRIRNAMQALGW